MVGEGGLLPDIMSSQTSACRVANGDNDAVSNQSVRAKLNSRGTFIYAATSECSLVPLHNLQYLCRLHLCLLASAGRDDRVSAIVMLHISISQSLVFLIASVESLALGGF
jgi:hypothetical protein